MQWRKPRRQRRQPALHWRPPPLLRRTLSSWPRQLPKKDRKNLRSVADEAKGASRASKKKIARQPREVEKKAVAASARLGEAVKNAEAKLAAAKKSSAKKARDAKKAERPAPDATEDLSTLTVPQLRERARDAGHAGFSRYTKAQLIALMSS